MPPKQVESLKVRDEPGWITFSIDGRYAYPSTGDVIDVATRKIVATLTDEDGRHVQSEKMVEIDFEDGKPVRAGASSGSAASVQARRSLTTLPCTSVRRKSRPWKRNVSRVWSMPRQCRIVALRSWMWTGSLTTL